MARSRGIKPAIMDNDKLAELSPLCRLLFIYLWMLADKAGRLEDRPKRIAAQALPYDRDANVDEMLNGLQKEGFIARYVLGSVACIQILAFSKHQTPHVREAESQLPSIEQAQDKEQPKPNLGSAETSPRSPDCGFLTPDSGLRTVDCGQMTVETRAAASETVLGQPNPVRAFPDQTFDELGDIPGNPDQPTEVTPSSVPSMAAAVCIAIKAAGIAAVNPSHPDLVALLAGGADIGAFVYAAHDAVKKGKGFNYLLGTVKGQMADAKNIAERAGVAAKAPMQAESFKERDDRIARGRWEEMTGRIHPDNLAAPKHDGDVIDITPKILEISQ